MSFLSFGVVSNCWSALLPGSSLAAECRRAAEAGFEYVELRQRGLAECEGAVEGDPRPWPEPDRLAELVRANPELRFNLAVEAPFLTQPVAYDPYLRRCAEAARAAGGQDPVLRLVDLSPAPVLLDDEETIELLGGSIEQLAIALHGDGVRLALENSKQPVGALLAVIHRSAFELPEGVAAPSLCWDPHNQITQSLLEEDPVETARTITLEGLFEFHFKQGSRGTLDPDVGEGDLDWYSILTALRERGYRGPALYEIPAGEDIWERLARSHIYVTELVSPP